MGEMKGDFRVMTWQIMPLFEFLIIHLRKKVGLRFMKFDGAGGTT